MEYLSKPYTDEQYAEFVNLPENLGRIIKEDPEKVWFEDQPEPSIEEKNEAIRATREMLYRSNVDPLTSQISRLRDEEQSPEVEQEIQALILQRSELVAKIREENPYIEESLPDTSVVNSILGD
nr:MAG TPA: hypothetical protein [Caudoviricetes sp.]